MSSPTESTAPVPMDSEAARPHVRYWPYYLLGLALILAGPLLLAVQMSMKKLSMPYYVPILATCGVVLMFLSVVRHRGVVRIAGLLLFAVLCGLEWYMLLVVSRTPEYTGPAQAGRQIPAFQAVLADGSDFTDQDLRAGQRSLLVFFRGRW